MKKQFLFLAMCIATILSANAQTSVWDGSHTTWTNGNGTQANPYLIENAAQLAHLAYIVNNGIGAGSGRIVGDNTYWKLMTDIDLKGSETFQWTPIGYYNSDADYYSFGGNFDGNGKTISNLYINTTTLQYIGLFGYTDGASIKNLGIVGSSSFTIGNASSYAYVGGLIGYANNTIVDNCYNMENISATSYFSYCFGGIVGYISGSTTTINNCYNTGNIYAYSYSGGIVGYISGSTTTINNCYNTGNISSTANSSQYSSGGIVGLTTSSTAINNCYNTGNISSYYSGGIIGRGGTINNCYNVGTISNNYLKGGIVASSGTVNNSYYLNTCGAAGAGQSKTEDFMKTAEFISLINANGFAYKIDITPFVNDGYPVLTKGFDMQLRPAANITQTKATLKCMLKVGDVNIKAKQLVCNNQTTNITSTDTLLTQQISGLIPNTAYSYTFRAINSENDTCKLTGTFTTLAVTTTTQDATNITQTKATLNGEVIFGDATVTKGFEYKLSTDANYTSVNVSGSNTSITSNLTGLLAGTTYQFRAFCTYGGNTIYGATISFTALAVTATTNSATDITRSTATLNGTSNFGDATVIEQGFILTEPTGNDTIAVSNTSATLTYNAADLAHGAAFSYKTYCTTAGGTVYGTVQNFNTLAFNTNGTDNLIEDKDDLILLANLVNDGNSFSGQTFILANDITLSNTPNNILSIGKYSDNYSERRPFCGTFNGNGKRIYNVYIDQPNTPYQGFFGYTQNAYLYEVGLVNITASGRNYTGGMVGYAENTIINDSYVSGGTLFALSYCGGLVGYQTQGTNSIITGCYNTCTVTGNNYVGGLLGYSNQGTVRNSYVAALVTGNGNGVGAIIGGAQDVLNYNCYFNDSITGQSFAIGENNISLKASSGEGNMSSGDMRMQAFVTTLNQGLTTPVWKQDYKEAINNGFPILIWQTNQSTGTVETLRATSLQVYPNPAKDYLFIQSDEPVERVEIYNQSGVCVLKSSPSSFQRGISETLDVSGLTTGFYLARIYVNGVPETRKIIIKK